MLIRVTVALAIALGLSSCEPELGPTPGTEAPTGQRILAEVAPPTESSRMMLQAFYIRHLRNGDSGVPGEYFLDDYRPYLSERLIAQLERAREWRDRAIAAHPEEKPPFAEGDLFSSLFEGPTGFTIGKPIRLDDDHQRVPVVFSNVVPGQQPDRWTDYATMVHEETGWKLDDLEYGGRWEFASKGRLSDALRH